MATISWFSSFCDALRWMGTVGDDVVEIYVLGVHALLVVQGRILAVGLRQGLGFLLLQLGDTLSFHLKVPTHRARS